MAGGAASSGEEVEEHALAVEEPEVVSRQGDP